MPISSKPKTATVSEMIHRFRTAPPTSCAVREAMRQNMDAPSKMWYEEINVVQSQYDGITNSSNTCESSCTEYAVEKIDELLKGLNDKDLNSVELLSTVEEIENESSKRKGDNNEMNWRYKFKDGL